MPKYKSFTEYLQDNYYGQIKESLLDFVKENGLRNDDGVMMKFGNYEIVSLKVYRVDFTKSEFSNVEFNFFIKVVFLVDDGFDKAMDSFVGNMSGSFKKGFKEKDDVAMTDDECEGVFTKAWI